MELNLFEMLGTLPSEGTIIEHSFDPYDLLDRPSPTKPYWVMSAKNDYLHVLPIGKTLKDDEAHFDPVSRKESLCVWFRLRLWDTRIGFIDTAPQWAEWDKFFRERTNIQRKQANYKAQKRNKKEQYLSVTCAVAKFIHGIQPEA